jgi:hypothetical protein
MRRFEPRTNEITVLSELLDRSVALVETSEKVTIEDVAMELSKTGDWFIEKVHIMKRGAGLRRRGASITVEWSEITGFTIGESNHGVTNLLGTLANLRAADLASVLHDLNIKRRVEVARALDDERLADVLEEMDEASRVELLAELEGERAADVLQEMDPDDAADLLREVGQERAQALLALMAAFLNLDLKMLALIMIENTTMRRLGTITLVTMSIEPITSCQYRLPKSQ